MSRLVNVRSSLTGQNANKLPGLTGKNKGKSNKATIEEVNELKIKTQMMETEKRQLKAKTARMKQLLSERNNAIKQVLTQSNEKNALRTASDSTIQQLKENVVSLQNTLMARQEELYQLRTSDKLAVSEELQQELKVYYLEHQRLSKQSSAVKEGERIIENEIERLRRMITETPQNENAISLLQSEIDQLVEKITAYRKSELRFESAKLLQAVLDDPKHAETQEKLLNEELNAIFEEIENEKNEIKIIEENDQKNMTFLQDIIDDQTKKIMDILQHAKESNNVNEPLYEDSPVEQHDISGEKDGDQNIKQ